MILLRIRQLTGHSATSCNKVLWFADGWRDYPRVVKMTSTAVRLSDIADEADRRSFGGIRPDWRSRSS